MKLKRTKLTPPSERRLKAADVARSPEEIEVDVCFDPAVDLLPEQIEYMEQALKERQRDRLPLKLPGIVMTMKLLFPEKDFFDEELWEMMLTDLKTEGSLKATEIACNMAIFAPERREEIIIKEDKWKGAEQLLQWRRGNGQWWDIAGQAIHMLVARPEKKAELQLDDRAWNGMLTQLDDYRNSEFWWHVSVLIMRMSLLFPERRNQIPPITKEEWEEMRAAIQKTQRGDLGFPLFAMSMFINSAESAEIAPSGQLTITHKKPPLKAEQPLPGRSPL